MPRIREVKVARWNSVQDVADDARLTITSYPLDDLIRAVGADYLDGMSHLPATSDIGHACEQGFGYTAAGLLSGATDCAHVDATCWAHRFNDRGVVRSGAYVTHRASGGHGQVTRDHNSPADLGSGPTRGGSAPTVLVRWDSDGGSVSEHATSSLTVEPFYDPRRDVYRSPDWSEWETWRREHGWTCPACEAINYDVEPSDACANCLSPLADGYPACVEAGEYADVVYGYVSALTWTDLQRDPTCPECGDPLTYSLGTGALISHPETRGDTWTCAEHGDKTEHGRYDVDSGATRGSDPYEYGPDDLDADALSSIRADVAGFIRFNLEDCRAYVERMGPIFDPSKGDECSAWERLGHDLYLTAAGHGAGFWDRGLGDLGKRLTDASKPYSVPNLYLDPDGVIS